MSVRTSSKSSLFLMELVIAILFFAVTSAICVRLFTQAHVTAQEATNLNAAVLAAQNAAECIQASADPEQGLEQIMNAVPVQDGVAIYFDNEWNRLPTADGGVYALEIAFSTQDNLLTAQLGVGSIVEDAEQFYSLTVKKYQP